MTDATTTQVPTTPEVTTQADGTLSVPTILAKTETAGTSARPSFLDIVPAEHKDKPWVQDFAKKEDPYAEFFKEHENQRSLIGKKSTGVEIPGEGATDETIKAFHKALGVPDSPDGYSYTPPDVSKEPEAIQAYLNKQAEDKTLLQAMTKVAHAEGLTPKQFDAMAKAFDELTLANVRSEFEATQKYVDGQRDKFNKIYGDQAAAIEKAARAVSDKVIPKEVVETGDAEIALVAALKFIHENIFKNDRVDIANAGAPSMDAKSLETEIFKLRADPLFKNKLDKQGEALRNRVVELTTQLVELQKQKS